MSATDIGIGLAGLVVHQSKGTCSFDIALTTYLFGTAIHHARPARSFIIVVLVQDVSDLEEH